MDAILIAAAVAGGLAVGWFLLKLALAEVVPTEVSATALLHQELKKHGVNPMALPETLKAELVTTALTVSLAHGRPGSSAYKASVVRAIEFQAEILRLRFFHPEEFARFDTDGEFQKVYSQHGLGPPGT